MVKITPTAELARRIEGLQKNLHMAGMAGALILHGVNLYYFTGTVGPVCFFIPAEGTPVYLTRQRGDLPVGLPWPVKRFSRWADLSMLGEFCNLDTRVLGVELDAIPAAVYMKIAQVFPHNRLVDIGYQIRMQRAVKSVWEIALLQETADRDQAMWEMVPRFLRTARTDIELSAMVEGEARRLGHVGILRLHGFNMEMSLSTITTGKNGSTVSAYDVPISGTGITPAFPFGASGTPLQAGNPILVDFGGCYEGYTTDQSRTFVLGQPRNEVVRVYKTALAVQTEVIAHMRPGATCGELFDLAGKVAEEAGLRDYFMGGAGGVPFIGHGVGLQVDELPVLAKGSRQMLTAGMVVALEPKFALPGIGAVGIENCFIITETGAQRLSRGTDDLGVIH